MSNSPYAIFAQQSSLGGYVGSPPYQPSQTVSFWVVDSNNGIVNGGGSPTPNTISVNLEITDVDGDILKERANTAIRTVVTGWSITGLGSSTPVHWL